LQGRMKKGKVFLIGAGPGDPGLITVKGLRRLGQADVVVYDHLVSPRLLSGIGPAVEVIYAGKEGGKHTLRQEDICRLLVEKAREGKLVARLKGGDPFVFGRGGEEALALAENGIAFEVVPGVTSALAAPAYAGIPATHRGLSSSVVIATGHEDEAKSASAIDWASLAKGADTHVFLMGVKNLSLVAERLMAGGKAGETPAAIIQWGTTPRQRTLVSTLAEIADKAKEAGFEPPAALVVGPVVSLREKIKWFEGGPLFGKRILVTRSRDQASELSEMLTELGAEAVEFPTIRIAEPDSYAGLDSALGELSSFDWVIFSSGNGVRAVFERLWRKGQDLRRFYGVKIAAIGPATAEELEGKMVRPDLVAENFTSEGLLAAMGEDLGGRRILLLRAQEAPEALPEGLAARGAEVVQVAAYKTVQDAGNVEELKEALKEGSLDAITFTSSSTVQNLVAAVGAEVIRASGVPIYCIGPVTDQTARSFGLEPAGVAKEHTLEGVVEALRLLIKAEETKS